MTQLFDYLHRFHPISSDSFHEIENITTLQQLRKNEILQPIGHTCKTIYFINKGIARIYYYKDGPDITEAFAFENEIVVRFESLFTGRPSQKAIQVLEDSEILAINAKALFTLYDRFPEIERLFRKVFESSHVESINRLERIQFHSAEERYRTLLLEAPESIKRVPLKYIASFLGITQVSLSRIRALR